MCRIKTVHGIRLSDRPTLQPHNCLNNGNATETTLLDLEPQTFSCFTFNRFHSSIVFLIMAKHVCCVNMDLHFILQVFRVIELKLGPQLKDLINSLSGRLLISCYTPAHQFGFSKKKKPISAGFLQLLVSNLVI